LKTVGLQVAQSSNLCSVPLNNSGHPLTLVWDRWGSRKPGPRLWIWRFLAKADRTPPQSFI